MTGFEESVTQYRRILGDLVELAEAPHSVDRQARAVALIVEYLDEVVENRELARAFERAMDGNGNFAGTTTGTE